MKFYNFSLKDVAVEIVKGYTSIVKYAFENDA